MSAQKIKPVKPFIILLYGFPGAGKTAFARQLAEELDVAHLQQDRLNVELYGQNDQELDKHSRKAMVFMTREFLRAGVPVIYDTDVHRMAERRQLRDLARQAKAVPVLVWIQVDPDTSFVRSSKRDRRRGDDHFAKEYDQPLFDKALQRMQNPENEEYVVISGKHTFQTQRNAVIKKLYELGILNPAQLSQTIAKPELVNLVPQPPSLGGRPEVQRRNINIR